MLAAIRLALSRYGPRLKRRVWPYLAMVCCLYAGVLISVAVFQHGHQRTTLIVALAASFVTLLVGVRLGLCLAGRERT